MIGALRPPRVTAAAGLIGGALLLVAGRPGRWRIVAGVLLAAPLAVVEVVRWFLT